MSPDDHDPPESERVLRLPPWHNQIEPWWKQMRSLTLKGRRFEGVAECGLGSRAGLLE